LTYTIAVSGKGGTGKTTLCGMLIKYLLDKGEKPILAVDADANSNLNDVLGVEVRSTIGEARELMKKDVPTGMTKEIWFEYKVNEALIEANGYDLLVMGRPEGPGCYCAANTLARKYIDILSDNYRYVVIDNEAGMEHLSRAHPQPGPEGSRARNCRAGRGIWLGISRDYSRGRDGISIRCGGEANLRASGRFSSGSVGPGDI